MQIDLYLSEIYPVVARLIIDILALYILIYGIFYRRYRDRELMAAAALSNISVFAVLLILSNVNFSIAAGFGLFAILALFTFRSEQMDVIQISYFFGSVAISVICSLQGTDIRTVIFSITLLLVFSYILDHPALLPKVYGMRVTLDYIDERELADHDLMCQKLSERLGVTVLSCSVKFVDYINEMVVVNVNYRNT
jgi:signal transduction histidine kinase